MLLFNYSPLRYIVDCIKRAGIFMSIIYLYIFYNLAQHPGDVQVY